MIVRVSESFLCFHSQRISHSSLMQIKRLFNRVTGNKVFTGYPRMNNRWNLQRKHPQFSFYRWPRISPGKQGRAFPNCEKTPWKRACLFRETVSDGEGEGGAHGSAKQEKLQPSNRLITNLSWVEIRTRSFGRNRCSKSFPFAPVE